MSIFNGPYGPLQPLRDYSLAHAQPVTPQNVAYLVIPLLPIGVQAILMQYEGTRLYRAALGVLGLGLMIPAGLGHRFVGEYRLTY